MFLSFVNRGHGNSFPSEQSDPLVGWLYFRRQFFFFLIRRHQNWGRLVALHRRRGRGVRSRLCWPRPCGLRGVVTSGQRPLLQEPDGQDRARSRHLPAGVSGAPLSGARGRSPRLAVVSGRHTARARTRHPVLPSPGSTPRTAMSGGHGVSWPRHSPRFLNRLFHAELFRVEIHMQFTEPQFYAHCKSRPQAPATELPDPPTFPLPGCDQPVGPLTPPVTHVCRLGALLFPQKSRVRG